MPDRTFSQFVMVPDWLIFEKISPMALRVWCRLALYGEFDKRTGTYVNITPAHPKIAASLGISVSTVKRAIAELESIGAIGTTKRWTDDGDPTSNSYRVVVGSQANGGGVTDEPTPVQGSAQRGEQGSEGVNVGRGGGFTDEPTGGVMDEPRVGSQMSYNPEPLTHNQLIHKTSSLRSSGAQHAAHGDVAPDEDQDLLIPSRLPDETSAAYRARIVALYRRSKTSPTER